MPPRTMAPTPPDRPVRIDWIDATKALSILLVVFHHAQLTAGAEQLSSVILTRLDLLAQPIRMPLFFALSGALASSALSVPWTQLLRRKSLFYYYLYVLWMVLFWLFCRYVQADLRQPEIGQSVSQLVQMLVLPDTGFWFLWMLAIFFTVGKLLDRWRGAGLFCAIVALALLAEAINVPHAYRAVRNLFLYAPFFLGAAWYGRRILPLIPLRPLWLLAGGAAAYAAISLWIRAGAANMVGTKLLLSVSGLVLAIGITLLLCRSARMRRVLGYIGRNTLPIYVVHSVLINAAVVFLLTTSLEATLWIAPTLAVLSVIGSLLLRKLLGRFGSRWLYSADGLQAALRPAAKALRTRAVPVRQS